MSHAHTRRSRGAVPSVARLLRRIVLTIALALLLFGSLSPDRGPSADPTIGAAAIIPTITSSTQFDVTGFLQTATLDRAADPHSGGSLRVNDQLINRWG